MLVITGDHVARFYGACLGKMLTGEWSANISIVFLKAGCAVGDWVQVGGLYSMIRSFWLCFV
jgi:hypothetical protein